MTHIDNEIRHAEITRKFDKADECLAELESLLHRVKGMTEACVVALAYVTTTMNEMRPAPGGDVWEQVGGGLLADPAAEHDAAMTRGPLLDFGMDEHGDPIRDYPRAIDEHGEPLK